MVYEALVCFLSYVVHESVFGAVSFPSNFSDLKWSFRAVAVSACIIIAFSWAEQGNAPSL